MPPVSALPRILALNITVTLAPVPAQAEEVVQIGSGRAALNLPAGRTSLGLILIPGGSGNIGMGDDGSIGSSTFNAGASDYRFNAATAASQDFTGTSITIDGGGATILNCGFLSFWSCSSHTLSGTIEG